jgi:hypothetical protein
LSPDAHRCSQGNRRGARRRLLGPDLQAQLKRLTGGLAPGIQLPKIKL